MNNKEFKGVCAAGAAVAIFGAGVLWLLSYNIGYVIFWIVCSGVLTGLFVLYTKKRYRSIEALNNYLSMILAGNYDLAIEANEEGELSILKNNIYKTTVLLKSQNEQLHLDKIYLAQALADISHQLKTPLTSMMVMNDLLENEIEDVKHKQFVDIQKQQLDKMNWLIQNLLKLSKLDAGTIEMKDEILSVESVIEDSIKPFLVQMELKNIYLKEQLYPMSFRGDANWTAQALQNIIKNCLEHMQPGGTLEIATEETTLYVAIWIKDDGCGITEDELPHIFERFYHGKDASAESVGIGLALSKVIIEKERGKILVTSTVDVGTTFEIRFYKAII